MVFMTRRLALVAPLIALFSYVAIAEPQGSVEGTELELQVKAAFVVSFAKFTQWPELVLPPGASIQIGIVGQDEIFPFFREAAKGKTAEGHPTGVRKIKTLEDARTCQILFFGGPLTREAGELLATIEQESILTVGDTHEFAAAGGMLQLFIDNNRIAFRANLASIDRSGLKVSSKLLRLAHAGVSVKERRN